MCRSPASTGPAAHDLARAADHARNASRFDRPDPDLPAPSDDFGLEDTRERAVATCTEPMNGSDGLATGEPATGSEVYVKAARDLYNAARRDLQAGRDDRAGELARASEAMTHVPEHLAGRRRPWPAWNAPASSSAAASTSRSEGQAGRAARRPDSDLPPILPPE